MKTKRPYVVGAIAALILVTAFAATAVRTFGRDEAPDHQVVEARLGDVEKVVLATGALQPFRLVEVGSQVSGQILSLEVRSGDLVKAGQVIARIDARRLEDNVRDQESRLASDRRRLAQFTSNVEMAEAALRRQQTLKDRGLASQQEFDKATAELRQRKAQLANFKQNLITQEIRVEDARNGLSRATITAPMAGIVAEIPVRAGQTINVNREAPIIAKIAKMDVMTVRTQVSEADIGKVRPGQKVYFTILGEPDKRYEATLRTRELTPVGGPPPANGAAPKEPVYYNALFEVPNPDRRLLPAMTAEVHVVLGEARNVVTVPLQALDERAANGSAATVRVLREDGNLEQREVRLGLTDHRVAEVKAGLEPGDLVVVG